MRGLEVGIESCIECGLRASDASIGLSIQCQHPMLDASIRCWHRCRHRCWQAMPASASRAGNKRLYSSAVLGLSAARVLFSH